MNLNKPHRRRRLPPASAHLLTPSAILNRWGHFSIRADATRKRCFYRPFSKNNLLQGVDIQ